jgi:hypothetical protein
MKTTVEIADPLLSEARKLASREETTVRALIEEGLRRILDERRRRGKRFKLRKVTFSGQGLQPGVAEGSWERVRDLVYEGRGPACSCWRSRPAISSAGRPSWLRDA